MNTVIRVVPSISIRPAGKNLITVLFNGDIVGCPTMSVSSGNIKEQSLLEIWHGDYMNSFRQEIPSCSVCDGDICMGGCRAVQSILNSQLCF